jgi:hypothetical protein
MNSQSERAVIDWKPTNNSFRYSTERGDPINYHEVAATLNENHQLDADGFAAADVWMNATTTNHYPLALERIVRGLTSSTLNPATILISLDNRYVNDDWLIQAGSRLVSCGSTHGGLDDINSDGILLSNFKPTRDTSTDRVAGQFENFPGVKNFRAAESGAEWVTKNEQALTRIARVPFDKNFSQLPDADVFLRVWSPEFAGRDRVMPIEVAIGKIPRYISAPDRCSGKKTPPTQQQRLVFNLPIFDADNSRDERIYALPPEVNLKPQTEYKIYGWIQEPKKTLQLFDFSFRTGANGRPAAY